VDAVVEKQVKSESGAPERPRGRELDGVDMEKALYPERPQETTLITMETSLSRLPSFRIVAGWIVLIVALFLAFIFTH
jgi:hypothetical protein